MADIQEILGTDLVKDSRKVINENFNKVACDFAGTAFPTNPNIGMVCYRTDENKAYRYVDNDVWKVEGSVLTVNNNKPNDNGNVTVDVGVTSVNGAKGAVTVFDGNYNNLSNKPTLAKVATSGNYNDLSNKPIISNTIPYGTCTTAKATAAKVVTVTGNFSLTIGQMVYIKFSNANTNAKPTLNINGTGAISMTRLDSINVYYLFVYDGSTYRIVDYYSYIPSGSGGGNN